MNLESSQTMQEVNNQWRGTQFITALVTAPELVLISLARFQYRRGQPRKLRQKMYIETFGLADTPRPLHGAR